MLRHAIFTSRRVPRVGLNSSIRWLVPACCQTRQYNPSTARHPTESPELPDSPKPDPTPRKSLPHPPEPSTDPLVDSDFAQYLEPLYEHGWEFIFKIHEEDVYSSLRRLFSFPSPGGLLAFTERTRHVCSADITVFRGLSECRVHLKTRDGATRSMIRLALELQSEYQHIVGPHFSIPRVKEFHKVRSSAAAAETVRAVLREKYPPRPPPALFAPPAPVILPPPPPIAAYPPPSIAHADLDTYINPLVKNGWVISGVNIASRTREMCYPLLGLPCLHRVYRFHAPAPARYFFNVAVATVPPPPSDSLAGVQIKLSTLTSKVKVWAISELAPGEDVRGKYGISHVDVRFALALEAAFAGAWAPDSENSATALCPRLVRSMDEVWDFGGLQGRRQRPRPWATPP